MRLNKLPLIPKSYLIEQSFVTILDPTSILFKNVTPYCSRYSDIRLSFESKLRCVEEVCAAVVDSVVMKETEVDDDWMTAELRERFRDKMGGEGNLVARLFGLPEFNNN